MYVTMRGELIDRIIIRKSFASISKTEIVKTGWVLFIDLFITALLRYFSMP